MVPQKEDRERKGPRRSNEWLLIGLIFCAMLVITAVCWHSVEEIHYLKTFFPGKFTVADAFYASGVEVIKVLIISLPLVLTIVICMLLLIISRRNR